MRRTIALVCAATVGWATHASAQRGAPPLGEGYAEVAGRVETPGATKQLPVAGVMVTVHRVGTDSSGPLDSVRTGADGHYNLRYTRSGDDGAVYFAAAVYRGIAYFTAPLQSARAKGEEAAITVFDTTSRPITFHVQGHHVVVSNPSPTGTRNIVEVWELSNDTSVTVLGRDSLTAVWGTRVPPGATGFAGGPGDVTPASLVLRGDSVALLATFGPGVKQISYTYTLPASSFPVTLPVMRATSVLEVLVEEPLGQVNGATLRAMPAATSQGRTFKRWLTQDVAAGEAIHIVVPATSADTRARMLIALASAIAVVMGLALLRAFRRRGPPVVLAARSAPTRESLIAGIAALDARRERGDTALDADTYAAQRASLKAQLAADRPHR